MKYYRPPTMTDSDKDKLRTNAARADMRTARKHGSLLIAQTTRGNVELEYNHILETYKLTQWGSIDRETETIIENATAARTREELKKLYIIEA